MEKTTFRSATPFSSLQYGRENINNLFQEPIFLAQQVSLFVGNRGLRGCVNETAGVLSGYAVKNQCLWKEAV